MPDKRINTARTVSRPNEKQAEFLKARERFIAYGGARGGGKSWAVRKKAWLLAVNYAGIRILLLRRTFPELRENHILPLMSDLKGIAQYKESEKAFLFPNGSRVKLGYCDTEGDVLQYQGQEYDVIFMDEATQFSEYQFQTLTACLRGANGLPKRMYLTCNPGGVGHTWVKRLFIDREYRGAERAEDYRFIPAKVYDNRALMQKDPDYVRMLENLPEDLRRAWLEGDWNIFVGQYFKDFRTEIHVLRPFSLPGNWRKYVSMDYGRDMFACYFIALDGQNQAYVYKEIYESGLLASEAAERLKETTDDGEEIEQYYAPPDLWNRHADTGKSTAEIFFEHGIMLTKVSNDRVQGWYDLAEWLKPTMDEQGCKTARMRIFENCRNLIRTLPAVQYDERRPNDVSSEPHELTHAPDALRYFVSGRPHPADEARERDEDNLTLDEQIDEFLQYGV